MAVSRATPAPAPARCPWMPPGFYRCDPAGHSYALQAPVASLAPEGLPAVLVCTLPRGGGLVVLTTSRAAYRAALADGLPAFGPGEYAAAELAARCDRVGEGDVARWCERKLATRRDARPWTLGKPAALGLTRYTLQNLAVFEAEAGERPGRTWGQLLEVLGLQLLEVYVGESSTRGAPGGVREVSIDGQ